MMKSTSLLPSRLLSSPCKLLLLLPRLMAAQQACQISQPLNYGTVHEQVISINTNVLFNTTFFPIANVGITIGNAPTSLDGITTFHWTEKDRTKSLRSRLASLQLRRQHRQQPIPRLCCSSKIRRHTTNGSQDLHISPQTTQSQTIAPRARSTP